eukprot:scaffold1786_cov398-Prasinococcus_capsulatus_cf.AAC.23
MGAHQWSSGDATEAHCTPPLPECAHISNACTPPRAEFYDKKPLERAGSNCGPCRGWLPVTVGHGPSMNRPTFPKGRSGRHHGSSPKASPS